MLKGMERTGRAGGRPGWTSRHPSLPWALGLAAAFLAAMWWSWRYAPLADPDEPAVARTALSRLVSPVERNAFLRRPHLGSSLVSGLFALPGTNSLWAVGRDGLILYSADGGASWDQQSDIRWEITAGTASTAGTGPHPAAAAWMPPLLARVQAQALPPPDPTPAELAEAQRALAALGLYDGAADGVAGPRTTQAIRAFQDAYGLPVDGTVTPPLLAALRTAAQARQIPAPPTLGQPQVIPLEQQGPPPSAVDPGDQTDIVPQEPLFAQPQPETRPGLRAVAFADARRGLVVGDGGVMLRTEDGGRTWLAVDSGTSEPLEAVVFADRQRAVAIGPRAMVMTTDGGLTWRPVDTGSGSPLRGIAFATSMQGVAVGEDGTIVGTVDGGATWLVRESGTTRDLFAVAFGGGGRGAAVGDFGTVLMTADDGQTWTPVAGAPPQPLWGVTFPLASRAVAIGWDSVLVITDGEIQPYVVERFLNLAGRVAFLTPDRGFAIDGSGIVMSRDGGLTWSEIGRAPELTWVTFTETRRAMAVGESVLSTGDGGRSWSNLPSGVADAVVGVAFATAEHAVAVGENGTILTTADGGTRWVQRSADIDVDLYGVAFATTDRAVAVGEDGTILVTNDRGTRWFQAPAVTDVDLYRVAFGAADRGVAVGDEGTIVVTADGGTTWSVAPTGTSEDLYGVAFATERHGLVVGDGGTVLLTTDGGATWSEQPSGTSSSLFGAAFVDADRAVAVGEVGTILLSTNGGRDWSSRGIDDSRALLAASFAGLQGITVGTGGLVLTSGDGGESWQPIEYARYPPPLFWLLSGGVLILGLVGARRAWVDVPVHERIESVADLFASDRPLRAGERDALGLTEIAAGISRFLRNRHTEPPLTIAVTGEWGSGKSSLMGLLYEDLRGRGFRPVWFNAWHHQRGEQLLASLYANIRAQGLPSWGTPEGWMFRWRLVTARAHRHWLRLCLTVSISGFVIAYLLTHQGWGTLLQRVQEGGASALVPLGGLLALVPPLLGAYHALRAFGVNPASLLGTIARGAPSSTAARPGVRYQFAEEFREVTDALKPRHLVIFIDDLDRCSQEHVLEVLEATNFLVTAGECYIVLGMSRRWVETCVGLAFRELAAEGPEAAAARSDADAAPAARDERRRFAQLYLQKLINVEVPIPRVGDQASAALLMPPERRERPAVLRAVSTALGVVRASWLAVLLLMAATGAYFAARGLPDIRFDEPDALARVDGERLPDGPPAPGPSTVRGDDAAPVVAPDRLDPFRPGARDDRLAMRHLLVGLLGVIGTLAFLLVVLVRRGPVETDDSPAFRDALRIMRPWIVLGHPTPRLLKRYLNAIRFVAMRDRRDDEPGSVLDAWLRQAGHWLGSTPGMPAVESRPALPEPQLVAFSALHQARPDWHTAPGWLLDHYEAMRNGDYSAVAGQVANPVAQFRAVRGLAEAIQTFNAHPAFEPYRLFEDPVRDRLAIGALLERMAGVRIDAEEGRTDDESRARADVQAAI